MECRVACHEEKSLSILPLSVPGVAQLVTVNEDFGRRAVAAPQMGAEWRSFGK
jgi:hypothetical protein